MIDFENLVARHGEFAVQAILEKIERYEGVRPRMDISLEERWNVVINKGAAADDARMVA